MRVRLLQRFFVRGLLRQWYAQSDLRVLIEVTRPQPIMSQGEEKGRETFFIMSGYKYNSGSRPPGPLCVVVCTRLVKVMEQHESGWERCCARIYGEGAIYYLQPRVVFRSECESGSLSFNKQPRVSIYLTN